ncbi:MAG: zinc ribbon domain-containing protein [Acidobacteria bacterium]|nr:zinc ribbon domain-containing protein [Acidobacteriota bacterium]
MAFCPSCGNSVTPADRFCAKCGAAQPVTGPVPPPRRSGGKTGLDDISPRNASILCYIPIVGWIAALFVLAADRFRQMRDVRFHAFQGLYLFVTWLIVDLVTKEILPQGWLIGRPLKVAVFAAWVYMLYQTSRGLMVRLPFIGELADRSVDEQK